MRCPKCQYISFGSAHRCRNCGYDFSLSEESPPLDLPIESDGGPIGPPVDLPLRAAAPATDRQTSTAGAAQPAAARAAKPSPRTDLPLFPVPDDAPLVTPPAAPRAPLAVRRGPPVIARPAIEDESEPEPAAPSARERGSASRRAATGAAAQEQASTHDDDCAEDTATPAARALAGVIDLVILGAVDLAVVYLTLRVLGLELADAMLLPKLPMAAFLLLLNGGYLVLFTAAGGQTIGKMAAGIRVIAAAGQAPPRVAFSTAVLRAAAYGLSLLPAGLGFLPIVFSPDRRGVHDRLAETRVVKA